MFLKSSHFFSKLKGRNLFLISPLFILASCGGGDDSLSDEFYSDTTIISGLYPTLSEEIVPIMEQLEMCTTSDTVLALPPCTHEFFRIFNYRPGKKLTDGFIVEMIPGLFGAPVHQIVIVENYMGKYQIINQYFGHLLEMRTTPSGFNDLLIGYTDPDIGVVGIKHIWQGTKYDIVDVEEIDGHRVKTEFKDSINNVFLPAFSAGH